MIGRRIRLAREACGFTQQELADLAGITQAALSQIESGRTLEPTQANLQAVSDATGFPLAFFHRGPLPDLPEGKFRKFARATSKRDEHKVQALTWQIVDIVRPADDDPTIDLPNVAIKPVRELQSIDGIEALAGEVRRWLRVGPLDPILNVIRAVERAGVVVFRLPTTLDDHDGYSAWPHFGLRWARPVLALTGDNPGDRERLTVAHELGHLVLHSDRPDVGQSDAEREAFRFAGALLIPREAAQEALQMPLGLEELKAVKAMWGMSMQALAMRAFDLGLITSTLKASIFKQMNGRGWLEEEPVPVEREHPLLIGQIVDHLAGSGSPIDQANRLGMQVFGYRFLRESVQKAS